MTFALRYTVRSDVGLLREGNEDSAYAGPYLLAIADGMGGHAAGEVASAVAISTLAPLDTDPSGIDMLQALSDTISDANAALRQITLADPATEGMGTTLTALLWSGDEVALCHIGDSRGYLLREGTFYQITHDHTLVQSLVDEGKLTPEAAASHPQRSLVLRALQSSIPADPDLAMLKAKVGDRFLLCSDGLTDVVSDETLKTTLSELTDLDAAVDQLVDLAIRSGGPDNITCVLADVIDTESGAVPTEQVIIVGALATGDSTEPVRSDNPAARARLLALGHQQAGDADGEGNQPGANGTSTAGDPGTEGDGADRDDGVPGDGVPGDGVPGDDVPGDDDDGVPGGRRWPVVTLVLLLLLTVVGGGGYFGWRLTQEQYYVGTANGRVVVYRGVSEAIGGLSLSSVVQRTNIPVSAVPYAEAVQIEATICCENLTQALRTLSQIKQDYQCTAVEASISRWLANLPKPKPKPKVVLTHRGSTRRDSKTGSKATATQATQRRTTAKRTTARPAVPARPAYPPKPVLPAYCPAFPGDDG